MTRRRGRAVGLVAAIVAIGLLATTSAQAQEQRLPEVRKDPETGRLIYTMDLTFRTPGKVVIGQLSQVYWFFNPLSPLEPAFGCQFIEPRFPLLGGCALPANGLVVRMGPGVNDVFIQPGIEKLIGDNLIQGGKSKDTVQAGPSDEKVKTAKGKDEVNPGDGEDDVKTGADNDKVDTRDGEKDKIDCGKGKRDVLEPDSKDRHKNCEKVK